MKKLLSIILASALCICIIQSSAFASTTHTVVYGDSMWKIAVKYQVPSWLTDIAKALASAFERMAAALERIEKTKTFQLIKSFLAAVAKFAALTALQTLADILEAIALGLETIDALLEGDFKTAWEKWIESLKTIALLFDPLSTVSFLALKSLKPYKRNIRVQSRTPRA